MTLPSCRIGSERERGCEVKTVSERASDLVPDRLRGRAGIRGARDRTADHEMIGAGPDGVGRSHDTLLVSRGGTGRADAGSDDESARSEEAADPLRLGGRADDAVHA